MSGDGAAAPSRAAARKTRIRICGRACSCCGVDNQMDPAVADLDPLLNLPVGCNDMALAGPPEDLIDMVEKEIGGHGYDLEMPVDIPHETLYRQDPALLLV